MHDAAVQRVLMSGLVLLAAGRSCAANPPAFDAWFDRITQGGAAGPTHDGLKVSYRVEQLFVPPEEELDRMREAVKGHPEHPLLIRLAAYQRRRARPTPEYDEFTVWKSGDRWRCSRTTEDGSYVDNVWGDGVAWTLTPKALALAPGNADHRAAQSLKSVSSTMSYCWQLLVNAGVSGALANGVRLRPELDGERWAARGAATRKDGAEIVFTCGGTFDAAAGWGAVSTSTFVVRMLSGAVERAVVQAAEWRYEPTLSLALAHDVRTFTDDAPNQRLRVLDTARFEPAEFEQLVRVPGLTGTDAFRGRVTFVQLNDARTGPARYSEVTPDRKAVPWQSPGESRIKQDADLDRIGWVIGGLSVALLIAIWLNHRRKTPG
ncbi:MAG: hypothetical protein JNM07_01435 [Phycisphaerae bacterium]|nr:hypothetical protein [Phycisphaerae bacterium]